MKRLVAAWNNHWFPERDATPLGIARIILVSTQLILLFTDSKPLDLFNSLGKMQFAYYPLPVIRLLTAPLGFDWFPDMAAFHLIFWTTVAGGFLSLIGLRTNVSLLVFTVGNVFLLGFNYSFRVMHHGDAVGPERSRFAYWPFRYWICLYSLVYLSAVYFKWKEAGLTWFNGYTLQYYALMDGSQRQLPQAIWMAGQRELGVLVAVGTMIFEVGFVAAVFRPALGYIFFPMGALFHFGIWALMGADFWEPIAVFTSLVIWLEYERRLKAQALPAKTPAGALLYDGHCPLCLRSVTTLKFLDVTGRLAFVDLESESGRELAAKHKVDLDEARRLIHLIEQTGRVESGFFAFRRLARYLPALWWALPIFYLPGASILGPAVYGRIAATRRRFSDCESGACALPAKSA